MVKVDQSGDCAGWRLWCPLNQKTLDPFSSIHCNRTPPYLPTRTTQTDRATAIVRVTTVVTTVIGVAEVSAPPLLFATQ
jgi:hypothetical protein